MQALHQLQTTASLMHTGAHPDDEDTALIARVARGDHARVAYLSLNRGEGGQNIIGLELFDALGVVRTEELLQARTLDGGEQLFTTAYDFGFTKTLEEAAEKWGEERILGDMVRAIRTYRPLVLASRFFGSPVDGHGQHQLAGKLTPIAFKAAADPARFPEQIAEGLRPWQVRKLYVGQSFRQNPENVPTLTLQTGVYDAVLGRTYYEIAMEGRSQHKSQEMGTVERRGPQASGLRLADTAMPRGAADESSVFEGIDTTVPGIPRLVGLPDGPLRDPLLLMQRAADEALKALDVAQPSKIVPLLADGLRATRAAREALSTLTAGDADARADAEFLLAIKERQFANALVRAAGVTVDVLADRETAAPGESAFAVVNTYVPDAAPVKITDVTLRLPDGWRAEPGKAPEGESDEFMSRFFRETPTRGDGFRISVPSDAALTTPYWLAAPRTGYVFDWTDARTKNQPFAPPAASGVVTVEIGGVPLTIDRPLQYRIADSIRGEIRRAFAIVPALTVGFDSTLDVVPLAELGKPRRIAVRLHNQTLSTSSGSVRLILPDGWKATPAEAPFTLSARGDRTAVMFQVTPALKTPAGRYAISAQASIDGRAYTQSQRVIAYPHIQTHRLYEQAAMQVRVFDLKVASVHVGYIMGSGDQVPDAIRRLGLPVTLLDADQLDTGDLSRFNTIVIGVRASESRPDCVANNGRLLDYVRNGGTLIVQYQQGDYVSRGLSPYPAQMASRVTDEHAPITILQPQHPVFTFPNRIADDDWKDWVQERNLYAFTSMDERYVALLETHDPGEPPQRGGQVYARIGKGHYIYTSYAWFRQLPAGVPGAYRLFANLLSLPKAPAATPVRANTTASR